MITTEPLSEALTDVSRQGDTAGVFTHIYEPDCQLAVWRRPLSAALTGYVDGLERHYHAINLRELLPADAVTDTLCARLPDLPGRDDFVADVQQLAEMFACLFELRRVGLRLASLQTAMCPRFHVDKVPCRLVTTYAGPGTHWLDREQRNQLLDSGGREPEQWQRLVAGEVALLKGDGWEDNDGQGLWHRSPPVPTGYRRLFLSLDFAE
ncbi:DUF1826 domain-containing protein [Oceanisphaera arctica]|uniref:Succinylglutamate desuccinylase n=1 Tax=Oceanisphaera arctica TaxID=641510 RepID=A0A2P5TIV7_9GAMM|nr:DUF1826 domain-containing protein [Oceanisphaera arctica]PPL14751.1 hypothetical protein UN63_14820 [Oceanisphaera arctica]GHA15135.1 hypothetical protein GCM10007082_14890 [Oceanisphaera arctica]